MSAVSIVGAIIEITAGSVDNQYLNLNGAEFLIPKSTIGGTNEAELADKELTIQFSPGSTIQTDIAGDKMIFRKRTPVREFFELAGIREGDRIIFERLAPFHFRVRKLPS